jgi:hypothetical protein
MHYEPNELVQQASTASIRRYSAVVLAVVRPTLVQSSSRPVVSTRGSMLQPNSTPSSQICAPITLVVHLPRSHLERALKGPRAVLSWFA